MKNLIASLILLSALAACDYIEAPYIDKKDDGGNQSGNPAKVLLFDFTGHTCKSCPKAHRSIDQMKELYGKRLIPVAFHLGYFAKPLTSGKFTTDFRTPEGYLLEEYMEFVSFPIGTVQTLNKEQMIPYASWAAEVDRIARQESPVKITIEPEYLAGLGAVQGHIHVIGLDGVEGQLHLAAYIVENQIIDWQKDEDFDPMDIPDYEHNNVFRTSLTGLWGEAFGSADGIQEGFEQEFDLAKSFNPAWNPDHCSLIVFVYRESDKQIIQAESVPLKE